MIGDFVPRVDDLYLLEQLHKVTVSCSGGRAALQGRDKGLKDAGFSPGVKKIRQATPTLESLCMAHRFLFRTAGIDYVLLAD